MKTERDAVSQVTSAILNAKPGDEVLVLVRHRVADVPPPPGKMVLVWRGDRSPPYPCQIWDTPMNDDITHWAEIPPAPEVTK